MDSSTGGFRSWSDIFIWFIDSTPFQSTIITIIPLTIRSMEEETFSWDLVPGSAGRFFLRLGSAGLQSARAGSFLSAINLGCSGSVESRLYRCSSDLLWDKWFLGYYILAFHHCWIWSWILISLSWILKAKSPTSSFFSGFTFRDRRFQDYNDRFSFQVHLLWLLLNMNQIRSSVHFDDNGQMGSVISDLARRVLWQWTSGFISIPPTHAFSFYLFISGFLSFRQMIIVQ